MKKIKLLVSIALTALIFVSCSSESGTVDNSISGLASKNSDLTLLVKALKKADLYTTLKTGSFTVFAPTNDAFIAAGFTSDAIDALPASEIPALKEILLNHVVSGSVSSSQLSNNSYIKTLAKGSASSTNTLSMYVAISNGTVTLNGGAQVVTPNVNATNGVIHIVDEVITLPTVVTLAAANPNFSTLAGLLTNQGLIPTLSGTAGSPFTVFAPSNTAFTTFESENPGTLASLSSAQVTAVLTYHVVGGANVLSTGIPTTPITTLQGDTFTISGTTITDQAARQTGIVAVDVQASNGVIHVINNVLLPNL
jgi:uncharacterized surface protein with fasciclin (FAS1) repeats